MRPRNHALVETLTALEDFAVVAQHPSVAGIPFLQIPWFKSRRSGRGWRAAYFAGTVLAGVDASFGYRVRRVSVYLDPDQ